MKIGNIEKQKCGICPIIDYCGEPHSDLTLCTDSRLGQVEVEEYIRMADKSKLVSMEEICKEIVRLTK